MGKRSLQSVYKSILDRSPQVGFFPKNSRVRKVLEMLGDPQEDFETIHIAGTNGKTTTARIANEILLTHDVQVGLFTSPHLVNFNERICVNGEPINEEDFLKVYDEIWSTVEEFEDNLIDEPPLSFFEIMTIIAVMHFYYKNVQVAVFEAGVGGMYDATNALDSKVAVITNVDFDHQQYLGDTLMKIAKHKAGIIKEEGEAVIIGKSNDSDIDVYLTSLAMDKADICLHEGNNIEIVKREEAVGGQLLTLRTRHRDYPDLPLNLFGEHQASNALLALTAVEEIFTINHEKLDLDLVKEAFNKVKSPGRFETLHTNPLVILDIAHNEAGVVSLISTLQSRLDIESAIAVVTLSDDKNAAGIFELVSDNFETVYITKNNSERSFSVDELTNIANEYLDENVKIVKENDLNKAIKDAVKQAQNELENSNCAVIIFGSVYNAQQAYAIISNI